MTIFTLLICPKVIWQKSQGTNIQWFFLVPNQLRNLKEDLKDIGVSSTNLHPLTPRRHLTQHKNSSKAQTFCVSAFLFPAQKKHNPFPLEEHVGVFPSTSPFCMPKKPTPLGFERKIWVKNSSTNFWEPIL